MDQAPLLQGRHVRLEPLVAAHAPALALASRVDRRHYQWTRVPDGLTEAAAYVETALEWAASRVQMPFVVVTLADERIVGTSRFMAIQRWGDPDDPPDTVEIGATWYADDVQGTFVNPEAKLLLLRHAFEEWRVQRVSLRTDARNDRSRRAIERLGATFEGVLRRADPASGDEGRHSLVRDTAVYSILLSEWPEVEAALLLRLDAD